jgi:hypothetical protein
MINSSLLVAENCQKIRIDDYVRQARVSLKKVIIEGQFAVNGYTIKLCETKTRFGGLRLWFECPKCHKRKGVLYQNPIKIQILCKKCFNFELAENKNIIRL